MLQRWSYTNPQCHKACPVSTTLFGWFVCWLVGFFSMLLNFIPYNSSCDLLFCIKKQKSYQPQLFGANQLRYQSSKTICIYHRMPLCQRYYHYKCPLKANQPIFYHLVFSWNLTWTQKSSPDWRLTCPLKCVKISSLYLIQNNFSLNKWLCKHLPQNLTTAFIQSKHQNNKVVGNEVWHVSCNVHTYL